MKTALDYSLSVITATHRPESSGLVAAARSVSGLRHALPRWDVQWIVVDCSQGAEPVPQYVKTHAEIVNAPQNWGPAVARNLALEHARGTWVINLDHDDWWLAGMPSLVELAPESGVTWVSGLAVDVDDDGDVMECPSLLLPTGRVEQEGVARAWQRYGMFPVMCSAVMCLTDVVRDFGGWAARYRSEDVAVYSKILAHYPGLSTATPILAYHRHSGQTVAQQWWRKSTPVDVERIFGAPGSEPCPLWQPQVDALLPPVVSVPIYGGHLNGRVP